MFSITTLVSAKTVSLVMTAMSKSTNAKLLLAITVRRISVISMSSYHVFFIAIYLRNSVAVFTTQ